MNLAALASLVSLLAAQETPPSRDPLAGARAFLVAGRLDEAMESLDAVPAPEREGSAFLLLQGRVSLAKGEASSARGEAFAALHYEEASRALRALLEKEPDHLEGAILLARARIALRDAEGASRALERVGGADSAVMAKARGDLAFLKGRLDAAALAYAGALTRDPRSLDPRSLVERLPPEVAVEALERAARAFEASGPPDPEADAAIWWWVGWLRYRGGEWSAARAAFERSFEKNPSFHNALYYAGRAAHAEGDLAAARRSFLALARAGAGAFRAVVRAEERDPAPLREILFFVADRAFREGRLGEACDLFGAITTLAPEDPVAWNNRAFLCRQTRRYEESYEAYLRAVALRRDDARLWNDAALLLHYHLGRDREVALAMYERAIECARVVLADRSAPFPARTEALAARKDAEENRRRLLAGRTGPEPPR